ncbi:hypothetical protein TWF281_005391 [Arthrobotrys megalospora]
MSDFPIDVAIKDKDVVLSWKNSDELAYIEIQLLKDKYSPPYFTKRVRSSDESITLTPEDYGNGDPVPSIPRYATAYRILPPITLNPLPKYKWWNEYPLSKSPDVVLGKDSYLTPWGSYWGTVGYHFDGVAFTGDNKAIAFTDDRYHVLIDDVSLPDGSALTPPVNWSGQGPNQQKFFSIGPDGSVKALSILAPDSSTYTLGPTSTIAGPGSSMTINGGSLCAVYGQDKNEYGGTTYVWNAWWVSQDGHIMHAESHQDSSSDPKVWSSNRTRVWHDNDGVSAITGKPLEGKDALIWFIVKHGNGQKGILYQSSRVGNETSTSEVQQADESECYVAPNCSLASDYWGRAGPVVAWVSPEGAVMALQQDRKLENDPVFKEIAPAGSASLESSICIDGEYIWWFGPKSELMGAFSPNRYDGDVKFEDLEWIVWEQMPAGTGRKGKYSIVKSEKYLWYAGADDKVHRLFLSRDY